MIINIIGFAYSGVQGLDLLHQLTKGKDVVGMTRVRCFFDFSIDQVIVDQNLTKKLNYYNKLKKIIIIIFIVFFYVGNRSLIH